MITRGKKNIHNQIIGSTGKNFPIFKYLKTFSIEAIPGSEIFIRGNNFILRLYYSTTTQREGYIGNSSQSRSKIPTYVTMLLNTSKDDI